MTAEYTESRTTKKKDFRRKRTGTKNSRSVKNVGRNRLEKKNSDSKTGELKRNG